MNELNELPVEAIGPHEFVAHTAASKIASCVKCGHAEDHVLHKDPPPAPEYVPTMEQPTVYGS